MILRELKIANLCFAINDIGIFKNCSNIFHTKIFFGCWRKKNDCVDFKKFFTVYFIVQILASSENRSKTAFIEMKFALKYLWIHRIIDLKNREREQKSKREEIHRNLK